MVSRVYLLTSDHCGISIRRSRSSQRGSERMESQYGRFGRIVKSIQSCPAISL
jgi:hypothetical protein